MAMETKADLKAQRDEYRKRCDVAEDVMRSLARDETPDVEDSCTMPDGTQYRMRVFGIDRAHGGTILISFLNKGYGNRETFDVQYWEDALIAARATATAIPDAWAYRDAFGRVENAIRELRRQSA